MKTDIYGGKDPRELPAYGFREAAHYLRVPVSTVRAWATGQKSDRGSKHYTFRPVLRLPEGSRQLSFFNLVEAFVLDALRRKNNFSLQKLRPAIQYLETSVAPDTAHPLAQLDVSVFNDELFVERMELLNLSRPGQIAMGEVLRRYLERVERGAGGVQRLYPFVRRQVDLDEPRIIVIDPSLSFGRPVIAGTGIPTAVVAERFKAGERIEDLASDYRLPLPQIEEALRCELELAA